MSLTRKFHSVNSNRVFLQECLRTDLIPRSFEISNLPQNHSSRFVAKWSQTKKQTSKQLIKIVVNQERTTEKHILFKTEKLRDELFLLNPEESWQTIRERLLLKNAAYQNMFVKLRTKKLIWLSKKCNAQDKPIVTSEENPPKQKRKWIKKSKWKRLKRKQSRKKLNVVFNYSGIELSQDMENLLNRGLSFAITPLSLNLSQVLVDFSKFERKLRWREFFATQEDDHEYQPSIFRKEKTNLPRNHKPPEELKMFCHAVKSEILDPENRNKIRPNLPPGELKALKELISLQRNRVITIKPCDKGAGIIILKFESYMESCLNELSNQQLQENGTLNPYYVQVEEKEVEETKKQIKSVLDTAADKNFITTEELKAMLADDKNPAKFYQLFKVHKTHIPGDTPPSRPIISGSGSYTENISLFVDSFLKPLSNLHPSYLQDTPDFLRCIEEINKDNLPANSILFSVDVTGLYTNIPQDDGLEFCREALENRTDKSVPTSFLIELLNICLKNNIFEFGGKLYKQLIGTAMGIHPAPSYANIFMAKLDDQIVKLANTYKITDECPLKTWKRFLDDCFGIWTDSIEKLYQFLDDINKIHPTIKFTLEHSSPFYCGLKDEHDC